MAVKRLSDLAELPQWAPTYVQNLWELIRNGETVSLEDEALALAELDHPEFALLWDHEDELPEQFQVAETSPRFHVQMHQVIETQLLENNPPGVGPALARLLELGIDRHAGIHLIMEGLLQDLHSGLRHGTSSNYHAFVERLRLARIGGAASSAKTGRNDPCPCGSGKKFKRCCGDAPWGPTVDPRSVAMVLADGFYAGSGAADLPPSHPLVTLENLSAVAQALEMQEVPALARAAYQQLVEFAELAGEELLSNALQDQMEFAMNHPQYTADGISAVTRLLALPSTREQVDMLSVELADLYATAGESGRAEALYHDVLARDPKEPYVYLRWARRLAGSGRMDAARAAYQSVIDHKGMGDQHALREARQELAKL